MESVRNAEDEIIKLRKQVFCDHLETEAQDGGAFSWGYEVCLKCDKTIRSFDDELEYRKCALSIAQKNSDRISEKIKEIKMNKKTSP